MREREAEWAKRSEDKVAADAHARDGLVSFGFFHRIIITSHSFFRCYSPCVSLFYTDIVVVSTLVFLLWSTHSTPPPFSICFPSLLFFFIVIIVLCSIGNDTTTLPFLSRLLVKVSDFRRIDVMVHEYAHILMKDIAIHLAE